MATLARARVVRDGMKRGIGGFWTIWWDFKYHCYRVTTDGTDRQRLGWAKLETV